MPRAWCSLEEVTYCFARSSVKFQAHTAKKLSILTQFGCFRTVTPVWIHQWLWNDAQSLKQHRGGALLFCQGHPSIFFRSFGTKNADFYPNCSFPECNSSLNIPMALKCCTKFNAVRKRCPIVFQGHLSNFKVTRGKKLPILTRIELFRTVTEVWLHRWIWSDAKSFTLYRWGALLFF